jgi:AbrB family looped-hinge helix DNA binding protein
MTKSPLIFLVILPIDKSKKVCYNIDTVKKGSAYTMRETGIIRRVDDLGRVVIPKEIRRSLGIREGEPLEIFVDSENKSVTFQRYDFTSDIRKELTNLKNSNEDYLTGKQIAAFNALLHALKEND